MHPSRARYDTSHGDVRGSSRDSFSHAVPFSAEKQKTRHQRGLTPLPKSLLIPMKSKNPNATPPTLTYLDFCSTNHFHVSGSPQQLARQHTRPQGGGVSPCPAPNRALNSKHNLAKQTICIKGCGPASPNTRTRTARRAYLYGTLSCVPSNQG